MAVIKKDGNYMGLPMNIARGNPIPLDTTEIWYDEAALERYAQSGATAYVGQIVQLVDEAAGTATAYIIANTAGDLVEVGSSTAGDNKTIILGEDGILRLVGTGDPESPVPVGAQLVMGDNGTVRWVRPDTTTVEGLSSAVEALNESVTGIDGRVTTAEADIDALERRFSSMGSIFNFAGSYTTTEVMATDFINNFQTGDVILVDGVKEYVCIEYEEAETDEEGNPTGEMQIKKRWETLGDPSGVTALEGRVGTLETWKTGTATTVAGLESAVTILESNVTTLTNKDTQLEEAIGTKASQSDLNTAVGRIGVNEQDIILLKNKDAEIDSALETKATITYVDNKVSDLNNAIGEKADQTALQTVINTMATDDELTAGLATKVDTSVYNAKMSVLESADSVNSEAITAARQIADQNKKDIGNINTELAKKALASDLTNLEGRVSSAESTISGHTSSINSLNGSVSSLEANKADKSALETLTNRVKANEDNISSHNEAYNALLLRVNGHDTSIENAQKDATQALSDAASAASAAAAAQAKGEEALAKAEAVLGTADDEATANTVYGAKKAAASADAKADAAQGEVDSLEIVVSKLDEAYKSADSILDNRVQALEDVIGGIQGAMHFVGVSSSDPTDEVIINNVKYCGAVGDVVLYAQKEYVCIEAGTVAEGVVASGTWVELGDVTAEGQRIEALEERMEAVEDATDKIPGIENNIAGNASAIEALTARVKANEDYKGTNDIALGALTARVEANEQAIAKEILDRGNAIAAEAEARENAITAEASAREADVNALQDQIDDVVAKLTWTPLGALGE